MPAWISGSTTDNVEGGRAALPPAPMRETDLNFRSAREPKWFPTVLFILCCVPAVLAAAGMGSDIIAHTRYFGSNPVKEGEHYLGQWTLRFIIASLTITPLRQVTGWNWLAKHRRTLGLFAFGYLMLHWLTYALLDVQLDWGELVKDLAKRPYIMIGMAALARHGSPSHSRRRATASAGLAASDGGAYTR